jgi:stage II sporulation protein AB (anti-sigma F factor)
VAAGVAGDPVDASGVVLAASYPAVGDTVPPLRREMGEIAAALGVSEAQTHHVRLAVSEAATNAVLHAYDGDPGDLHVTVSVLEGWLSIALADDGRGLGRSERHGGGVGFRVIKECADQLSVVPRPSGGLEIRIRFNLEDARE